MNKSWLTYFNLSDPYERKARFLPAVLSVLPLLPVAVSFGVPLCQWSPLLIVGTGGGAIVAVALSYAASMLGNRLQNKLWPDWPHDAPTNRWLQPDEKSISSQQKKIWYQAIKNLVQIDIEKAVDTGDSKEIKSTINDAITALRCQIWKRPEALRVQIHNIDYGFARNFTGLRVIWSIFSLSSFAGCWFSCIKYNGPISWLFVSSVIMLASTLLYALLPTYVRKKADYYAESFFGAVVAINNEKRQREKGTNLLSN